MAAAAVLAVCVVVLGDLLHWLPAAGLSGIVYLVATHLLRVGGPAGLRSLVLPDSTGDADPEGLLTADEVAGADRRASEGPLQ